MAQVDNNILLGVISFVGVTVAAAQGIILKIFYNHVRDYRDHKKDVMYKDTCKATHEGMEKRLDDMKELFVEKFTHLENLVKKST